MRRPVEPDEVQPDRGEIERVGDVTRGAAMASAPLPARRAGPDDMR
jgi:hypothetical protein